ncbi:MAG: hypothetical protein ACM3S5_09920 [Rhodospirillales bacterium]
MPCKPLFAPGCALLGLLTGLFGLVLPLSGQPAPAFVHQEDFSTNLVTNRVPKWSGTRLVVVDYDGTDLPVIRSIDREGRDEEIALEIPGAKGIHVFDYAAGFDGAIAAVGYAFTADSPEEQHYLVWISPDRKRRTVVRLSPYVALGVALAGDGSIWTIGGMRSRSRSRGEARSVLRRFDPSGQVLASSVPNGRARANIAPEAASMSYLFASPDRVGWLTNGNQFIEFALDGRELGRFDGPPGLDHLDTSGVAMDAENEVLVGDKREGRFEVWRLNRSKRAWEPVSLNWPGKPRFSRILGFDGTTLIAWESHRKIHRHARTLPRGS